MDRTIIPNGLQEESLNVRKYFSQLVNQQNITLAYVTGRHLELVKEAITEYDLPTPAFAITDVGTKIYQNNNNAWLNLQSWEKEIDTDWNGHSTDFIKKICKPIQHLTLQEASKQNEHKLSFYIPVTCNTAILEFSIRQMLKQHDIDASIICSIDETENIGLLDILPKNATKLHGIQFLQQHLNINSSETLFAGDSGNDIPVLSSPIPSVLVANASNEVKQKALADAKQNNTEESLYYATGNLNNMNGNYCAGVLEGFVHFHPNFETTLQSIINGME